jgi:hypothetical protein
VSHVPSNCRKSKISIKELSLCHRRIESTFNAQVPDATVVALTSRNSRGLAFYRPAVELISFAFWLTGFAIVTTLFLRRPTACSTPGHGSQHAHEGDEILFFLFIEFKLQDDVEELHGIFQRQKSPVMEIRRAFFDPPKREGLDRTVRRFV